MKRHQIQLEIQNMPHIPQCLSHTIKHFYFHRSDADHHADSIVCLAIIKLPHLQDL